MLETPKKYTIDNAKNDIQNLQSQNLFDFQEIKRLERELKNVNNELHLLLRIYQNKQLIENEKELEEIKEDYNNLLNKINNIIFDIGVIQANLPDYGNTKGVLVSKKSYGNIYEIDFTFKVYGGLNGKDNILIRKIPSKMDDYTESQLMNKEVNVLDFKFNRVDDNNYNTISTVIVKYNKTNTSNKLTLEFKNSSSSLVAGTYYVYVKYIIPE